MNILYIAYSCNPFAGSEDKIGWCVPFESSKTNKVYVITKEEQREPVERYLQSHPLENIEFYYVDIPAFYKKKSSKDLCILEDLMCGINGPFLLQRKFVRTIKLILFTKLHRLSSVQLETMGR